MPQKLQVTKNFPECCDKIFDREIFGFYEPYCIAGSRSEPIPVAIKEPATYQDYCCTKDFKRCAHYQRFRFWKPRTINPPLPAHLVS